MRLPFGTTKMGAVAEAGTGVSVGRPRKRMLTERQRAERKLAWMLCAPAVIIMALVAVYPIIYAIYLSFLRYDLRFPDDRHWVGFTNYGTILSSTGLCWQGSRSSPTSSCARRRSTAPPPGSASSA